jgi:tetratricopeptide (TPR) repeat protein
MSAHHRSWPLIVALTALAAALAQPACARAQQDGDADRAAGRYDDAITAFRTAAEAGDVAARRKLVRTLMDVGRYDDAARAALNGSSAPAPDLAATYGALMRVRGRTADARAAFERARAGRASDSAQALLGLALLDVHAGARARAFARFDRFIDIYNAGAARTSDDLMAVGIAVGHLGRRDPQLFHDASAALQEAIAADAGNHEARVALGELFLAKFNTTEAGALFGEVLGRNPHHPGALLGVARVRIVEGTGDAAEPIAQALATNPGHAGAYLLRARLAIAAERYDSADVWIARAAQLDTSSHEARTLAAATTFLRGGDAEQAARAVLARDGAHSAVYTTMAELAVQNRRYRDAVQLAARAIALDSTDWSAHALLGLNMLRIGPAEPARAALETAFHGDPFNVWVKNTLDLLDTYPEYRTVASPRFAFLLHEREAELLFPYASALAEEAYDALAERYGYRPDTPVRVEIYPRHADFSVRTVGLAGLGALGVAFGNILALDSPAAREPGAFNWGSTLWHEIAHAVTLGASRHRVPRWLTEGISVREERRARSGWGDDFSIDFALAYQQDRLRRPSELNAGFMRPRFAAEVGLSYYLASLVVEWIEEAHGSDALRAMLRAYADGAADDQVLRRVLGLTAAQLDREFDAWLRARYATQLGSVRIQDEVVGGAFLTHLRAGRAALAAGDTVTGRGELERAAALFPEFGGADSPYRLLARLHERTGDLAGAAAQLARQIAVNETDLEAHRELARLRARLGDARGAADALERAVYIHPFERGLHEELAAQYAQAGDRAGVVRARAALVALDPVDRAEALYQLALAQHEAGDDGSARRTVLRALEIAPNYEAAQQLLLQVRR